MIINLNGSLFSIAYFVLLIFVIRSRFSIFKEKILFVGKFKIPVNMCDLLCGRVMQSGYSSCIDKGHPITHALNQSNQKILLVENLIFPILQIFSVSFNFLRTCEQPGRHLIERLSQLSDFILRFNFHGHTKIPLFNLTGRLTKSQNRAD